MRYGVSTMNCRTAYPIIGLGADCKIVVSKKSNVENLQSMLKIVVYLYSLRNAIQNTMVSI